MTTIFPAQTIHTMDPANPEVEAVAVDESMGRILAVGATAALTDQYPDAVVDRRFDTSVMLPGFVEAHSHLLEGMMWAFEYIGYFDRRGADGEVRPGSQNLDAVLDRLRELDAAMEATMDAAGQDRHEPLIVWGFDPIYLDGDRLVAHHLDSVSETRPIFVFHASAHLATVNTALMRAEGFFVDGTLSDAVRAVEGVPLDDAGLPIGELQEPAAMTLARGAFRALMLQAREPSAIERLGQAARWAGLTTITELGVGGLNSETMVANWLDVVSRDDYPIRVSAFHNATQDGQSLHDLTAWLEALAARSTDKMRFGHVKIVLDGSIQGFTARLNPPGYLPRPDGTPRPNGIWLITPERFHELVEGLHQAGVLIHVHCNGDEAVDLFIETFRAVLTAHPRADHRHTVQHSQLTTPEQYEQLAELGVNANLFSNHMWFWGDQHHDITVGAERAATMNSCATADRLGVRYSVHCDASVTPFGSLHTAWCAVNRVTPSGRILGADECISVDRAMRAITIDAAHQLHMDDEIGTIEVGKLADFVALADDPYTVDPMALRDIEVVGTVLGGRPVA